VPGTLNINQTFFFEWFTTGMTKRNVSTCSGNDFFAHPVHGFME